MKDLYVSQASSKMDATITSFFLVVEKETKTKRDGQPYLCLTLADRTGQLSGKIWDGIDAVKDLFEKDDFVKVRGRIGAYRGQIDIAIEKIRYAENHEIELEDYLPRTAKDINELWAQLLSRLNGIKDEQLRLLTMEILLDNEISERFRTAPAAQIMHHAYIGGLLEHVVSMCGLADAIADHYGSMIHRDLLIVGVVLHDLGKVRELSYTRSFGYTDEGQLVGHVAIGLEALDKAAAVVGLRPEMLILVRHLIISHHGTKEHGACVEPRCPEALALHAIDNLDSKMNAIHTEMTRAAGEDLPWTSVVRALSARFANTAKMLRAS